MNKEIGKQDQLEDKISRAWKAYLCFLIENDIPLPGDIEEARRCFRGGFVYCLAYFFPQMIN